MPNINCCHYHEGNVKVTTISHYELIGKYDQLSLENLVSLFEEKNGENRENRGNGELMIYTNGCDCDNGSYFTKCDVHDLEMVLDESGKIKYINIYHKCGTGMNLFPSSEWLIESQAEDVLTKVN